MSRHKASKSETIESSILETKEHTNVKQATVDGVAPSTPAKSPLNEFFPRVSNHTQQNVRLVHLQDHLEI